MVLLMLNETIIFLTMVRSHWRGWHIVLFEGGSERSEVERLANWFFLPKTAYA